MSYSLLSRESRQQLEQERTRLIHDRNTIISAVTAEIDRAIQQLNELLGMEAPTASTPVTSQGKPAPSSKGGSGKTKATIAPESSEVSSKPVSTQAAKKPKLKQQPSVTRRKRAAFDPKKLKRDFKGMSASDAIVQVMLQAPEQTFGTDELMGELYEAFDAADLPRARKSVSAVLMQGARAGKFERVQESPGRYKLSEPAGI